MLTLKSYHNAGPRKRRAWHAVRTFLPPQTRFFYEGCLAIPGQLWYRERKALYHAIRQHKPENVFEVGTWYGGGSTFFITQALHDNGIGTLYTVEPNLAAFEKAVSGYEHHLQDLVPFVNFFHGSSTDVFPDQLKRFSQIGAVFLDGAQDAIQSAKEFELFERYLKKGSILMAHDWDNDKMQTVRPKIEESPDWLLETRLTAPHSLGFVVFRNIGAR